MNPLLTTQERKTVRDTLEQYFNLAELKTLAFDLGINYEKFPNDPEEFARDLVLYCQRHDLLYPLVREIMQQRPHVTLTHLLSKLNKNAPNQKIQIIIPREDLQKARELFAEVIKKLGYSSDNVEYIAAARSSIDLLVALPKKVAGDLLTIARSRELDRYQAIPDTLWGITDFSQLSHNRQEMWRNFTLLTHLLTQAVHLESDESLPILWDPVIGVPASSREASHSETWREFSLLLTREEGFIGTLNLSYRVAPAISHFVIAQFTEYSPQETPVEWGSITLDRAVEASVEQFFKEALATMAATSTEIKTAAVEEEAE